MAKIFAIKILLALLFIMLSQLTLGIKLLQVYTSPYDFAKARHIKNIFHWNEEENSL